MLSRLQTIRNTGEGDVAVAELLLLLGVDPEVDVQRQLESRGAIEFEFDGDGRGSFWNEGPPLSAPFGPGELIVPPKIAGRITLQDGEASFDFDEKTTIVGKALFLELKLQRVEVSEHHIAFRLPGGIFDQEYRF